MNHLYPLTTIAPNLTSKRQMNMAGLLNRFRGNLRKRHIKSRDSPTT